MSTLETSGNNGHMLVEGRPDFQAESAGRLIEKAYERWGVWRELDHTQLFMADVEVRREYAADCEEVGILCKEAAELAQIYWQQRDLGIASRDLRLNAPFLTADEPTPEKLDSAIGLSIEMMKLLEGQERITDNFDTHVKLYDLQHLIAFWETSLEDQGPERNNMARAILGGSIIDSANDLLKLINERKEIAKSGSPKTVGQVANIDGHAAEFLLLTVARLNLLYSGRVDELLLRSATFIEDSANTASKDLSVDLAVQAPHSDSTSFIQCKIGKNKRRSYAPHIAVLHVNWQEVIRQSDILLFLISEFTESTDPKEQSDIMRELNAIMNLRKEVVDPDKGGGTVAMVVDDLLKI